MSVESGEAHASPQTVAEKFSSSTGDTVNSNAFVDWE